MSDLVKEFNNYRSKMNDRILSLDNKTIKKIYNADHTAYQPAALDAKTKEFMGLVASMVLRCDDCIKYHLQACFELGATTPEIAEVFGIANLVGGTIVIPHTRRALEFWDALTLQNGQQ